MTLPALGENIEKGTVTKILVNVGDTLKKGQNILEIETDKAVLEVPSASDGLVKEILIKAGTVIKVGQPIFKIEGSICSKCLFANQGTCSSDRSECKLCQTRLLRRLKAPRNDTVTPNVTASLQLLPCPRKDIPAAPSVRLLARELGIDIGQVPGSGKAGRISIEDVKAYCKMLNTSRPAGGGSCSFPSLCPILPNGAMCGVKR